MQWRGRSLKTPCLWRGLASSLTTFVSATMGRLKRQGGREAREGNKKANRGFPQFLRLRNFWSLLFKTGLEGFSWSIVCTTVLSWGFWAAVCSGQGMQEEENDKLTTML